MSKVIDASAIIRAWEYYPQRQFPGFWRWVAAALEARRWLMAKVNLDEVRHKVPELQKWLIEHDLQTIDVTNEIVARFLKIKQLLGIMDDRHAQGYVDEPDLILIATCACLGHICVNCEAEQLDSKQILRNSKIPRVCRVDGINVPYTDLVQCVREADVVFDDFPR